MCNNVAEISSVEVTLPQRLPGLPKLARLDTREDGLRRPVLAGKAVVVLLLQAKASSAQQKIAGTLILCSYCSTISAV